MEHAHGNKNTIVAVVILLVLVVGLFSLRSDMSRGTDNETIKIGAVLSLSGSTSSFYGEYNKNAIDLYVADLNKKGGIKGKKVEVLYQDSKGDKVAGIQAFNFLVEQGIKYFISDISPVTVGIAPLAEQHKVILIATSASNPTITTAGDYVFRTKMAAQTEGAVAAKYISENLKPKSLAFIYQNSDYGVGVFNAFSPIIASSGVPILIEEKYAKEATDMRAELVKIKDKNPELVVIAGFPKEVGMILKQADEMGLHTKFFAHSGSIGPDIEKVAGSSAKGLIYLTELDSSSDEFLEFKKEYMSSYGVEPELFASNAYDAVALIVKAVGECGNFRTTTCAQREIAKTNGYKGVSGIINFDENGDIKDRNLILLQK